MAEEATKDMVQDATPKKAMFMNRPYSQEERVKRDEEELEQLKKIDLAKKDHSGEVVLTESGKTLLTEMKLQPKVMKRNVIDTGGRPTFLDDLLGEL